MSVLHISMLGGFTLAWGDGAAMSIPSTVARSLFAYLVIHRDHPHTRDLLAGTFWPDLPDAVARRRLSQALWQIRQTVDPHPVLLAEGDTIRIDPELSLWLDVAEFEQQAASSKQQDLALAADLYRGEFLAGYYDDWVLVERERRRETFVAVLGKLVESSKGQGEYESALLLARRLVTEDPWREEAHREVMCLCHLLGRGAEALKQFETCRQVLAEELGAEPSPETEALAAQIAARSDLAEPPVLPSAARPRSVPLLERPGRLPLVGRQAELAELLRQVEAAARGQGGLALVFGEAGVGKTRLVQELACNAEWRGMRIVWGRCYELAAPPAYQPLVEALRAGLSPLREAALEPLWRGELARLLPELAMDGTASPPLPPAEEQRRLLEAVARAFLALAATAPYLLLLEDIHWIDLASLEALRYLLPRLADARLLVVATLRTEDLTGQQAAALNALENTRLPRRLDLARLDRDETGELVRQALDLEQAAPRFSTRLYAETEGNPFFLIETLRGLMDEGLLRRDAGGAWSTPWDEATQDYAELPLPTGVAQSIQRRLSRLPVPLAEALSLAAIIGREVVFDLWQQAANQPERELLAAGDELCSRGLLLSADPDATGADYVFAHDQIRRVTYERLAAPRRRLYHRQVAEALMRLVPDEPEALAHHWTQAGVWDQAAIYHQQAGDRARAVYANAEATAHYAKALDALSKLAGPPDPDRLFALRLDCEAVNGLIGDRAAQARELDALEALVEKWPSAEQRAQVALRRARYSEETGDYAAAIATAQAAVTLTQSAGAIELEGRALMEWGRVLWRRGEYDTARAQFEEVLALAEERDLRRLKADALNLLGNVYLYQGDYAQARACYERTLPLHRELGNRQGEGSALYNLGYVVHDLGDLATASAYYQQALDIYREIGFRRGEGTTLMIYGNVLQSRGDYLSALDHYEQALHILSDIGNRQSQALALANIGSILMVLGAYAAARPYFEQTLSIQRELGDRRGEGAALASLSSFFYFLGDNEAAEEHARQALSIFLEIGDRYHQGHALTYLGHALSGLGQLDAAADAYRQAVELRCELGELHLAMESLAGLLRISLAHGDLPQALDHTERILNHLEGGSLDGTDEPMHIYLTCYRALHAAHDPRAAEILETAHALLQERAAGIDDEGMRRSFLENVAAHREIVAAYRERQPQRHMVRLPRVGAPTGRPLRDDEHVAVAWTLSAPEDGQVAGKTARRRQQLLRLLRQAEAQGAAPTVDDLAVALDASRATLKRDLAALRRAGHEVKTRGSPK